MLTKVGLTQSATHGCNTVRSWLTMASRKIETFLLFSQDIPSQNLGFVDPKAQSLTVTVSGRDFTVHQSPGILSSSRAGGTTGAGKQNEYADIISR